MPPPGGDGEKEMGPMGITRNTGLVAALALGVALALPAAPARASHCGDTDEILSGTSSRAVDVREDFSGTSICPALCRRVLQRCRFLLRREISCHRAAEARDLASNNLECRVDAEPGKARQECRASNRRDTTSELNDIRQEFENALDQCDSIVSNECDCDGD
jgi:hypothetical protein